MGRVKGQGGEGRGPAVGEMPAAHTVMFWFLLLLAFSVFAPCVLLPVWVRYAELYRQEQVMAARVAAIEATRERQLRTIEALRTDPAVNERVALRELRYSRPGAKMKTTNPEALRGESLKALEPIEAKVTLKKPEVPPVVARLQRDLPKWPLRAVFCESPSREVCLGISIALMALGFWLYARRAPRVSEKG